MAVAPLNLPGIISTPDITPTLANLVNTINEGQKRQTLADLGRGIADGTLDYKQAAGKMASTGNLSGVVSLLQLGEAKEKQARELAASQQFNNSMSSIFGPNSSSASIGQPAAPSGPTVPNDSNAMPGTVGMNLALADRSQDFIQDNPNTYLSSGVRSTADQARLYADRGNNPNPVAVPGTSRHERGLAIDIGGMTPEQRAMLPQYGLAQPVANDPPHVELAAQPAPVQVAQAAGGAQGQSLTTSHIPMLLGAMANPNLPAAQKETAKLLLTRALDESKLPDQVKQYVYAKSQGYQGSLLDFKKEVAAAGKTDVNILPGEKEYDKQSAKDFAEMNRKIIEGSQSSRMKLGMLTRMDQLLSDPKIYTGAGADMALSAKKMAKAIGVDVGDVSGPEAVKSIGNQLALELRNPAGGAGMPGALSDSDRRFLLEIPPGLGNTPEGNRKIVEYMKRTAQRSLDVERLRQDYVKKNGRLNEGFYRELEAYSNANPLFPEAKNAAADEGTTATNPKTGERLIRRNGKWESLR